MPDLKPGTLCWLIKSHPDNDNKIVEVEAFSHVDPTWGELYRITSRHPLTVKSYSNGIIWGEMRKSANEPIIVMRSQLVPINDPKLSIDLGVEAVEEQLKSLPLQRF